jgi:hypothetical protein
LKVTIRLTHLIKFLCFEGIGYLIRNVWEFNWKVSIIKCMNCFWQNIRHKTH